MKNGSLGLLFFFAFRIGQRASTDPDQRTTA
jgi:hypothetical protein